MPLDRYTILAVSSLISLVLGVLLLATQFRAKLGAWATCWGAGTVMLGLAGADQVLKEVLPAPLLISGGNVLAISGYIMVVQAARLLAGRAPRWTALAGASTLIVLPLALSNDPAVRAYRVAYNNALLIIFDLWVAVEAFRLTRRERLNTAWIMLTLFAVTVPFSSMRLVVAISAVLGQDTLDHARVNTWLAALLAVFWSLRGAIPALLIAERSTRDLSRLARYDALTGALNRVGLTHYMSGQCGEATFALLDLDHFKSVNDRYGHAQGDAVLRALATTVYNHQPGNAVFARLGGDEFLLVLPGTDEHSACRVFDGIRRGFETAASELIPVAPIPTISIGVSTGHLAATPLETLIATADEMLYRSKEAGRNRISCSGFMPVDGSTGHVL